MHALRVITVLLCLGVLHACLNSPQCVELDQQAAAALTANDFNTFCSVKSKALACFHGDIADCPTTGDPLAAMKTSYYTQCGLTAEDVSSCQGLTQGCESSFAAITALVLQGDMAGFCTGMRDTYLTCVETAMAGCNQKVTLYDIVQNRQTTYDQYCAEGATGACEVAVYSAGCQDVLVNITDITASGDFTLYCRKIESYQTCIDGAIATCETPANRSIFMQGIEEAYQQYCKGSPVQTCQLKVFACNNLMAAVQGTTDNVTLMCDAMREYMSCVDAKMEGCDPSVNKTELIGPFESSFTAMCGGKDNYCPGMIGCMQVMAPEVGAQPSTDAPTLPDITSQCRKLTVFLSCMDTELTKCGISSERSYDFSDISQLMNKACLSFVDYPKLMTCNQMTECAASISVPSEQPEATNALRDPQYWCSLLKSTIKCAESTTTCDSSPAAYTELFNDANRVCPNAPLRVVIKEKENGNQADSNHSASLLGFLTITAVSFVWMQ